MGLLYLYILHVQIQRKQTLNLLTVSLGYGQIALLQWCKWKISKINKWDTWASLKKVSGLLLKMRCYEEKSDKWKTCAFYIQSRTIKEYLLLPHVWSIVWRAFKQHQGLAGVWDIQPCVQKCRQFVWGVFFTDHNLIILKFQILKHGIKKKLSTLEKK